MQPRDGRSRFGRQAVSGAEPKTAYVAQCSARQARKPIRLRCENGA